MLNRVAPGSSRRITRPAAALGVLALVTCTLSGACGQPGAGQQGLSNDQRMWSPPPDRQQVADPVRLRIPAIGVNAPAEPLELDEHGVLPPPATDHGTGWWRDGPEPGERGPAVIVGHVDSFRGAAVFFHLHELRPGDMIFVDRRDGTTVAFTAQRTEQYGKDSFPTQAVYADTPDPQLRLITCGGRFDETNRRYLDNVIVYAQRVS